MEYGWRRFLFLLLPSHNDGIEVGLAGAGLDLLPLRLLVAVGEEEQAEALAQLGEHAPRVLGQGEVLEAGGFPQEIALGRQVSVGLPAGGLLDGLLPVGDPQVGDAHLGGIVTLLEQLGLDLIANEAGFPLAVLVLCLQGLYHLCKRGTGTPPSAPAQPGAALLPPSLPAPRPLTAAEGPPCRAGGTATGGPGGPAAAAPASEGREGEGGRTHTPGQYLLDGAPPRRRRVDQRVVQVEEHRLDAVHPHGAASRESRPALTAEPPGRRGAPRPPPQPPVPGHSGAGAAGPAPAPPFAGAGRGLARRRGAAARP